MKKVLLINVLICIFIYLIFEVLFYFKGVKVENLNIKTQPFINIPSDLTIDVTSNIDGLRTRKYVPDKIQGKPIILTGGSFANSFGLAEKDTLANQLAVNSNRIVFERAFCGGGINEVLYTFKQDALYNSIEEPEYVIYLFIENHFSRMFSKIYSIQSPKLRPMYNISNDYEAEIKPCYFKYLFLSHIFKYFYREKVTLNYGIVDEDTLFKHLMALQKEIKKHWTSTKLVFLRYSEGNIEKPYLFTNNFIKNLEKNNIIYLDSDELIFGESGQRLIGEKYIQEDGHPNSLAFKLLAPKITERLNNDL